ncbi:S41 family peptidase [uncultured Candidatus Puniceispirillum sp.]|jgi:carboxyl-terminal processing protease|uniref:S41 family peptidase n=1 Tax=uncultured Candidatus Puniceispirillum sp. TaxID=1985115 RepID=UPI002A6D01AC|nr:S41 family peptidase [Candidatus Puniceispirillum sp.]
MQRPLFSDSAGSGRSSFGRANLGGRKKHRFLHILLICSFIAAGGIGISLLTSARADKNDSVYQQLGLFGDIFQRVRESYVDEVDDTDLIEAAIKGMLTSLDPHSSYLNTDNFNAMKVQTQGRFGGLGIEITMENGMVKVVSPIDDTPAAKAGIQPEDYIIAVDDESIIGMSLSDAVDRLRGKIGSKVTVKVQRAQDEPFDVSLIRDSIKIKSVRYEVFDGIGYVRLTTFSEQTTPGLIDAIDDMFKQEDGALKGVILDLRNNPGGLLDQAISVSDAFLEKGEIVSTRGRNPDKGNRVYATAGDIARGLPMVVLINSGSASASEIVAGALKDHKRALLLGTRSFGKGSVQSVIPVSNTAAMRLTTARYYTPSGISIQAKGIEPDIEVLMARIETLEGGITREENLKGALDSKSESDEDDSDTKPTQEFKQDEVDYQLARALDLIRGVSVFSVLRPNS